MSKKGFTLLETLIVLLLLSVLIGVSSWLFVVSLRAWDSAQQRTSIREDINYTVERLVRELKEIKQSSLSQYSAIAHTIQYDDLSSNRFVLYLYNAGDVSLDSTYGADFYQLRRANITSGENPSLGQGVLLLRDLVSPDAAEPATGLIVNGNQVSLNLVVQRESETVIIRTKVRPRNL